MKRFKAILATMLAAVTALAAAWPSDPAADNDSTGMFSLREPADTTMRQVMRQEENSRFFNGVIPPTPQAASIARYTEYPVSHTTGIPDITIPLYEIKMGGYTLPISISYHSSGTRPDEIPTCVGLGWTLNAGGAVTRTILGEEDFKIEDAAHSDYTYYDADNINGLVNNVLNGGSEPDIDRFVHGYDRIDTESDRYTFNAGSYNGVFRYSREDNEFVILDKTTCYIAQRGTGENSCFTLFCPDNTVYCFTETEKTGADPDEEDAKNVTAWYPSSIDTPYGNITFKYCTSDDRFFVKKMTTRYVSGYWPYNQYLGGTVWETDYIFDVRRRDSAPLNYYYNQKRLDTIEWQDNTIKFNYEEDADGYSMRLASMIVTSSAGEIVKTVIFHNTEPWLASNRKKGGKNRRMLRMVEDSAAGEYRFGYDESSEMPDVASGTDSAKYTDSWGYYNGYGDILTETLADWLCITDRGSSVPLNISSRNRRPSLYNTRLGVLTEILFPTGAKEKFEYELNEFQGNEFGGLRLASTTTEYNGTASSKRYSYRGEILTQQHPDSLSKYLSYQRIVNYNSRLSEHTRQYKTVSSSPLYSAMAKSCPVMYMDVTETDSEGSSVRYVYDPNRNGCDPSVRNWRHPHSWEIALDDFGSCTPLLKEKTTRDKNGVPVLVESTEYRTERLKEIQTGTRVISVYNKFNYEEGYDGWEEDVFNWSDGVNPQYFLVRQTKAFQSVSVPLRTRTCDLTTGFETLKEYTYDNQYRGVSPLTVSQKGSDGNSYRTEYRYSYQCEDNMSNQMAEQGLTEFPVSTLHYAGDQLLSVETVEYDISSRGWILPYAVRSWECPTSDRASERTPPGELPERERVNGYNALGRPLSVTVNGTETTIFGWDSRGDRLLSVTRPGGLVTTYTHRPLFGPASVTAPNGHRTGYAYNSAGMLSEISDHLGVTARYSYGIINHPDAGLRASAADAEAGFNTVTTVTPLDRLCLSKVTSKQYFDGMGRPVTTAAGGMNQRGKYVYTSVGYDGRGREASRTLAAVGGAEPEPLGYGGVESLAAETYGDNYASSIITYDALDRPVETTTPGKAWHDAGKTVKTEYISNAANSVRLYSAPMSGITLQENGYYAAGTLSGVRTVDEDGMEMTVYTDRLGRKVLERRGPERKKGECDTYYVHDALGRLRYVLSPQYELSGYKSEFAYEYRYDSDGNTVKKIAPGTGMSQYWYDRAGRRYLAEDAALRTKGLKRFTLYDRAGRPALQGTALQTVRGPELNTATPTETGSGGFENSGYAVADPSRLGGVRVETVTYYDDYRFTAAVGDRLVASMPHAPPTGLSTGGCVLNSDGSRTLTAIYYDLRGNVTEQRSLRIRDNGIPESATLRVTLTEYDFRNRAVTTSVSENGVTSQTETGYDPGSDLPLTVDLTVSGKEGSSATQRIKSFVYDNFGRVSSVTRAGNSGESTAGGCEYRCYDIHGRIYWIDGPGFKQELRYADGPGVPCYNGNVSSMFWSMGTDDPVRRGYRYSYDILDRLTLAEYGEGSELSDRRDRYTERISEYSLNGMPRRLQRHGLKADGRYGKVDNLHIYLGGNRLGSVLEDADAVTKPGSMDYAGTTGKVSAFGYDEAGRLTLDESRGIKSVEYDNSGNPVKVSFADGARTENVYSAAGVKLRSVHVRPLSHLVITGAASARLPGISVPVTPLPDTVRPAVSKETFEYRGPVVYRNGKPDRLLFDGGYATFDGGITFHYYTRDYLGNVRAVVNGTTGAVEQTTAYYPWGGVIADLGTGAGLQPYKFCGKELVTANGLDEYDFGARRYFQAVPSFTTPDPEAEKFYWLSPYVYCAGNPIKYIDPDGRVFETLWDIGQTVYDVGAAVYNHINGNHSSAVTHWADAAFDGAAILVPGLPAGVSKIVRQSVNATGKVVNAAASATRKGSTIARNRAVGKAAEDGVEKALRSKGVKFGKQVRVVPNNGKGNVVRNRSTTDMLIEYDTKKYAILEVKANGNVPLSPGQNAVKDHILNGDGMFEIRTKNLDLGLDKNAVIKIDYYLRIDWNKYSKKFKNL